MQLIWIAGISLLVGAIGVALILSSFFLANRPPKWLR